jgi:hypothetical protein
MPELISPPAYAIDAVRRYRLTPRPKPVFRSVLDPRELLATGDGEAEVALTRQERGVEVRFEFPLRHGRVCETFTLVEGDGGGLASERLLREVFTAGGDRLARREEVLFSDPALPLPRASYPEVMLPFVLSWQPFDGEVRDLFAWINDRLVARVDYHTVGEVELELPGGRRETAAKMIMYPDFNDWVPMGKLLTRLIKPFLPKYHMWFRREEPHTVLRFEGPYGPPGAPEIVLELLEA